MSEGKNPHEGFGDDEEVRRQLNATAKFPFGIDNVETENDDSIWRASTGIIEIRERILQKYGDPCGTEIMKISNLLVRLLSGFLMKSKPHHMPLFFIAMRVTCDRLLIGMTASDEDLREECSRGLGWLHTDDVEQLQLPELMEEVEKIDKLID